MLNRLEVATDDIADRDVRARLLISATCPPLGLTGLSLHYWGLVGELVLDVGYLGDPVFDDTEVMRLLEEAGGREKLEVWIVIIWKYNLAPQSR